MNSSYANIIKDAAVMVVYRVGAFYVLLSLVEWLGELVATMQVALVGLDCRLPAKIE